MTKQTGLLQRLPAWLLALYVVATIPLLANAQEDSQAIKNLYDRALDFDESKLDSFPSYITRIKEASLKVRFEKGGILAERLEGIEAELDGDYKEAITHYLACLGIARQKGWVNYEHAALSDLGIVYTQIKNPAKAKEYYREAAVVSEKRGEEYAILNSLTNLGAICNQLHEADSALYYLNKAADRVKSFKQPQDLTSLRNNLGNAWFAKKDFLRALPYFRQNYQVNLAQGDSAELWYDVLNMGDVMIELKQYDSARYWIDEALRLAIGLGSKRKEADTYQLYAKYYDMTGNYRGAFSALQQWNRIDTSLVNAETRQTIVEMDERYKARQREQENKLLQSQVLAGTLRFRNLLIALCSIAVLAIATGVFLYRDRVRNRKLEQINALVHAQNEKLADLNAEKNALISMVSHDLHTPFTTIHMWAQVLDAEEASFTEEQRKAIERIRKAAAGGEQLINRILDVEASDVNRKRIQLEPVQLHDLLRDIARNFQLEADMKGVILLKGSLPAITLLSDRQLLERAISNLLSNALKFSSAGDRVWLEASVEPGEVQIKVRDEGPGISPEDQRKIFAQYTRADASPTGGEKSTGLGLFIVQRIMHELQGSVTCTSAPGEGATFTLHLRT
jgi:signal transduction histidine kinase